MSAALLSAGQNIGSAYELADGGHAWSLVIRIDGKLEIRDGRHRYLKQASAALLAAAIKLGVSSPKIENLSHD